MLGKITPVRSKVSRLINFDDQSKQETKRIQALYGRTCPYEEPIKQWNIEDPNEGMTPELERKLEILDKALEGNKDEEYGHYLIEKLLGFDDEPDSIKFIEEFEAKYFN